MKRLIVVACLAMALSGCGGIGNSWTMAKVNMMQGDFRISLYSGGQAVKVWEIKNGYVSTEAHSDGWYFTYNGKLVRVAGTVTIEQL